MDEVTNAVAVKEEGFSDYEHNGEGEPTNHTVTEEEPSSEVTRLEILCDLIEVKEENDDGEEEEVMEMASVIIPETDHLKFESEGENVVEDLPKPPRVRQKPGPKSRKRKQLEFYETDSNKGSPVVEKRRSTRRTATTSRPSETPIPHTYRDNEVSAPDNLLYCDECGASFDGDCPEHGPLIIVEDIEVPIDLSDQSRASKTAPPLVQIADSKIPGAGSGVLAVETIPPRTRFGPFEGVIIPIDECTSYSWLIRKDGEPDHCLDGTELGLSNWMRFVNCPRDRSERNLVAFQYQGKLYYRSICKIEANEELLVWCGEEYGRQLDNAPDFSDEAASTKDVKESFKCPACPFAFANTLSLERHKSRCRSLQQASLPNTIYKCSACPFTCANIYYMERHQKTCKQLQGSSRIIFQCSHCAYTCANTYFLERHRKHCSNQFSGNTKISFKCSGCSFACSNTHYLERHKKYCRAERKPSSTAMGEEEEQEDEEGNTFICTKCYEVFYDEETLASHQMTHAGENPLICKVCNERFFDLDTLTSHVQVHYGDGKGLDLSKLMSGYKHGGGSSRGETGYIESQLCLRKEPVEVEDSERFPCPLCGIQFFLKDSLTVHLRVHRGEKPFLCLECDVGFTREDYLRRHSRMHHEGKPFVCAECGKKYSDLVYLKQHQRKHKVGPEED